MKKVVAPEVAVKEVTNAQELEAALKAVEPGKDVKIIYKADGKEVVLQGTANQSE